MKAINKIKSFHWIIIIFTANLLFRLIHITYGSYFLDEAANLWYFQQDFGVVIDRGLNDPNPPGYGILIWGWIKLFGVTEFSTRFFSVLALAFCGAFLFIFSKKYFNLKIALISSLFFILSDYLFYYSHAARPYALLCFEVVLSYYFLFEFIQKRTSKYLIGYLLINLILLYTHPTTVFNLLSQGIYLFLFIRQDFKMVIKLWLLIILSVLGYYIWYSISPFFDRPKHTWLDPPSWMTIKFTVNKLFGTIWLMLIFIVGAIISMFLLFRYKIKRDKKAEFTILVLCWGILPLVLNILFSILVGVSIFSAQYIITVLPGFFIGLAIIINYISRQYLWICTLLLVGLVLFNFDYNATFREDWKGAVSYVKIEQTNKTAVYVAPQFQNRSFAFYYEQSFYEDYNNTFRLLDSCDVFLESSTPIDKIASDSEFDKLLLIISSHSPEKNPNVQFLMEKHNFIGQKDFESVHVLEFNLE